MEINNGAEKTQLLWIEKVWLEMAILKLKCTNFVRYSSYDDRVRVIKVVLDTKVFNLTLQSQ